MALTDDTGVAHEARAHSLLKSIITWQKNGCKGESPMDMYKISDADKAFYLKRAAEYRDRELKWKIARVAGDWSSMNIHAHKMACCVDDFVLFVGKGKGVVPEERPHTRITKTR